MSDCSSGLSSQIKALHARLDRVDDDLIAHYAGISNLVRSLAANPFTAGSMAANLPFYNFSGQTALKKLLALMPGVSAFRRLQHLESAALVSGLGARLEQSVSGMAQAAIQEAVHRAETLADAELALANATASGALETELQPLREAVTHATSAAATIETAANKVAGFLESLSDIANCKTRSKLIQK